MKVRDVEMSADLSKELQSIIEKAWKEKTANTGMAFTEAIVEDIDKGSAGVCWDVVVSGTGTSATFYSHTRQ